MRDVFDEWARSGRAEGMERGHGPAARPAFEWLAVQPDEGYLDVGCGNGYTVRWAAAVDPSVRATGLDVSSAMIERARAMSADHPNASFVCSEFPTAHIAPGTVDAAFSMEVLYYLPDLPGALRAIRDLLAPGGRFACVVDFFTERPDSHSWPDDLGVDMTLWSAAEWRAGCVDAGLVVADQQMTDKSLTTLCTL